MWHKTLVEEEVNIGVIKIETSPMLGQSLKEDSRVSIVGNLVISERIVDTLRRRKALLMMLNPKQILMRKTPHPLQAMRKNCYSLVNKLMSILQTMSVLG